MPIIKKPDYTIFASEAKNGELTAFPNLLRGWGVTIDQTAGKPPMEWFNALQKRTDEWLTYLSQQGISEWDNTLDYPKTALVQSDGKFYVSIKENRDQKPGDSQNSWQEMIAFLGVSQSIEDLKKEVEKKLTKDQNGADIPDPDLFIKNLGLGEGSALPVGVPVPWPSATPPTGWLKCNGAAFTAAQYPRLAQAYPSLKLPDLRGEFIRGWDDGRGADSGRELLSAQSHALQQHTHTVVVPMRTTDSDRGSNDSLYSVDNTQTLTSSGASGNTATETRPRNVAFNYIVRAA